MIALWFALTIAYQRKIAAEVAPLHRTLLCGKCQGKGILDKCGAIEFAEVDDEFLYFANLQRLRHVWYALQLMGVVEHEV